MNKPNCYKCKHRRDIPGDTYSQCHHPAFRHLFTGRNYEWNVSITLLASARRILYISPETDGIKIKCNSDAARKGHFCHPFNYDPR